MLVLHVATGYGFLDAHPDQEDETDGSHDEDFQGVPAEQEHQEVEPAGAAVGDEVGADARCEQVGRGQEHRWDAPAQAVAGADRIEQDVGGHAAPQEVAGVDARRPE